MGKLKPIGSEKLEGVAKIQRMMEIAKYNHNTPNPINETKSYEYTKLLADGNNYHIVKEKSGYVIKVGLNESTSQYIEPIKNRKYYQSYSQAMKRLNLMTKELNSLYGYNENVSLFNENDKIKYFLNIDEQGTQQTATQPAPQTTQPAPTEPTPEMPQSETPPTPETDVEMEDEIEIGIEPSDDEDEVVTYKSIQKVVGKLAQKTREFLADEENELDTKQIKYIVNSILSALPLDNLDEEDRDEIMSKFEGGEDIDVEDVDFEETDVETEDMPTEPSDEVMPASPEQPEGEMQENLGAVARVAAPMVASYLMNRGQQDEEMKEMIEGMFNESKVDKVLNKYFKYETKNINKIERLSESYAQEKLSKKLIKKYPEAKFLGKTNKGNLVFEIKSEKFFITQGGDIL